jgi:hypothetical protein
VVLLPLASTQTVSVSAECLGGFWRSKVWKSPGWVQYIGRRVDILGRSLPVGKTEAPTEALQAYLSGGRTASARALAKKAMVLIYPETEMGRVIWPIKR